jgi:hypothetical protein
MDQVFDIRKGGVTVNCELSPQFATIRATVYLKQMEPKKVTHYALQHVTRNRTQHSVQSARVLHANASTTRGMVHGACRAEPLEGTTNVGPTPYLSC